MCYFPPEPLSNQNDETANYLYLHRPRPARASPRGGHAPLRNGYLREQPGLQHWTEFLRATPWPGIYEIFVEANPSRAFLGFPSNPSDTADWLYVAEGISRTFQTLGHLPSVPTNYSGGYSFHLRGLRWAEDTAGPSSLATFPGSEMKTDSLYLYAAGTPEPSRTMLAFAGLCAAGLRRRG